MNIGHRKTITITLFVLFAHLLGAASCRAASFSADLLQTESGEMSSGKFFLKGQKYRMDVVEDGQSLSILVDRSSGKTRIVVPSEKAYLKIANNSMQSLMKNPFEAYQYMLKKYKKRSAGSEALQGLACEKQIISMDGKDVMTAWIAARYTFPVRIINPLNHYTAELKNIEEKPLTADLFAVPAGFKQVKEIPVPAPGWAGDIGSAPILKAPFSRVLSAGEIIRVKPVKGAYVKLEMAISGDKPCQITAVAFKNGRPVHDPSYRTYTLSQKGQKILTTNKAQPGESDEIVVRVTKGTATVRTELEAAPPAGVMLKKARIKANRGRQIDINYLKASHLIVQDDPDDGQGSHGTIYVFETVPQDAGNGVTAYQNKRVAAIAFNLSDGASRMWPFSRDRKVGLIGIDVSRGAVNVRIEQPEKAGTMPPSWANMPQAPRKEPLAQPAPPVRETGHPRVIFILDASGSMWGRINGKPKIVIAKAVMDDLVDHLPSDVQVGLMAYGHRRKGDCKDIELLVPVGSSNAATLKAGIDALQPKGKTPLTAAVEQAAENLRYTEERATVVLVSDGLETCHADPCRLAQKLAMRGVDFTVHVIGFDLSIQEQARLRCLADKTGGLFLAASDAGALRRALLETVAKVKQPPPVVKEAPGTAQLDAPDSVPAGASFAIKWQGPDSLRDYIAISQKGSKDAVYVDYVYTKTGNPVRMLAPGEPGDYELRYTHEHSGRVIGRRDIRVTPVGAQITAPASVAVATEFAVKWKGPAYATDFVTIARPDQTPDSYLGFAYVQRGNPAKLRAPADPGAYEVRYILGRGAKLLARASVTVQPVSAKIEAPAAVKAASRFTARWQGPGNPDDLITIARPDQTPDSYLGLAYVSGGNPARLTAPQKPGTYEVRYILGYGAKLLARVPITVRAP